jgi:hypothetical protein
MAENTAAAVAAQAKRLAAKRAEVAGVPDLSESKIEADSEVRVHVAWSRVMAEVDFIKKGSSPGLRYDFRGIDAVLNAVGPALRKHGVIVMPVKVTAEYSMVTTKNQAVMNYCRAVVQYIILGPRGDTLSFNDGERYRPLIAESLGEAFDAGDKASTKAQSIALREFYIKAFAIPVDEPARDTEYGVQHEIAGPPRPTAAQYQAWIRDESTSIARLHQIKAELDGDATLNHAVVEGLDGEEIELGRLIRRVGAARSKEQ